METDTVTIELPASLAMHLQAMARQQQIDVVALLDRLIGSVEAVETNRESTTSAFRQILARSVDLGVSNWAERHDHHLYGINQR